MNSFELADIGSNISNKLKLFHFTNNTLILTVDGDTLRKMDEDLYYRQNPNGKDFKPSENEIKIKFDNLTIIINKENAKSEISNNITQE